MDDEYTKVTSAIYDVLGDMIALPIACLQCNKKGLVLMWNNGEERLEAHCGPREDAKGTFSMGCNRVSYASPISKAAFDSIADDPHTIDYFFVMKIF